MGEATKIHSMAQTHDADTPTRHGSLRDENTEPRARTFGSETSSAHGACGNRDPALCARKDCEKARAYLSQRMQAAKVFPTISASHVGSQIATGFLPHVVRSPRLRVRTSREHQDSRMVPGYLLAQSSSSLESGAANLVAIPDGCAIDHDTSYPKDGATMAGLLEVFQRKWSVIKIQSDARMQFRRRWYKKTIRRRRESSRGSECFLPIEDARKRCDFVSRGTQNMRKSLHRHSAAPAARHRLTSGVLSGAAEDFQLRRKEELHSHR